MGRSGPKPKPFECPEPVFWYLVGLIATDGCLSRDGRHIDITSANEKHLSDIRRALNLSCRVTSKGKGAYHIQIGSSDLYRKLQEIGLTPRKSLTLGALAVPDAEFSEFFRGVIDGDGGIRHWRHPSNGREQWTLRISSASRPFVAWLEKTVERLWCVHGRVHEEQRGRFHPLYKLKYGKLAGRVILGKCYYPGALSLERKRVLAEQCLTVPVGWSKSATVPDASSWNQWEYVHRWQRLSPHPTDRSDDTNTGLVGEPLILWKAGVAKPGKRTGLKTQRGESLLWVRLPPPALSSEGVSK